MRFNFRNASLFSVLMALSFTGTVAAEAKQPVKTKTSSSSQDDPIRCNNTTDRISSFTL